ncbi:hypothetical protein QLX08_009387 [Tetragonisca angustula]|uniref:Uncharacterized protein n=1 Tax=Tetragonisca angustula TaxID=166442 RepID=A0AAW0ZG15_9HYME
MKHLLNTLFIFNLLANVMADPINCQTIIETRDNSVTFFCTEVTSLMVLEMANINSTYIEISDSRITDVPRYSFERFAASLITLDLHGSSIRTVSPSAFISLGKLQNLLLWGNKLKVVKHEWFINTYNLRTLDVSFNDIEVIEDSVFGLLPNLENFYFDYNKIKFINYNMFAYLRNLKNVKFEKNPLNWGYRAYLTWQLENQQVKYGEDWEEWGWMNVVIKECSQSGYGEIPKDTVLDCIVENLLNYTYEVFSTSMIQQNVNCIAKARQLVRCMRPKNVTGNTDNETARRILEDYTAILPTMSRSNAKFSTSSLSIS